MIRQEVGNRQGGLTIIVSGSGVADNASRMRDLLGLTDEQGQMRDLVRAIARERIAPRAARGDETETYPADQLAWLGEQGLMGLYIPEAYGGTELGALAFCLAVEEIAWACASTAVIYLVQYAGGFPIVMAGSESQKRRYLPRLAAGETTAAFSLSEPGAGSDAASLTTTAERRGDRYLLNGTKMWVPNGSHASVITLFATVDRGRGGHGVTAFLVEPASPTPRNGGSSTSRSRPSRGFSSCSPTWRCRCTRRASWSTTPRRSWTAARPRRRSSRRWRNASRATPRCGSRRTPFKFSAV